MNPAVDSFFQNAQNWKAELSALREIALECGLIEEFKWKQACYTHQGKNIFIVSSFKKYAFISFFKGALLKDEAQILVSPGEHSEHTRLIPITNLEEIESQRDLIKMYIFEAIENEENGLKIVSKKIEEFDLPEELLQSFAEDPAFEAAFYKLTRGRQKGYFLHFSQAKQAATRLNRIQKFKNRIMMGKGMNDCVCGLSKRMPNCDGSHKNA